MPQVIPATPQLLAQHMLDARQKPLNVGDIVAYKVCSRNAYGTPRISTIEDIKFTQHDNGSISCECKLAKTSAKRRPGQLLKLEQ